MTQRTRTVCCQHTSAYVSTRQHMRRRHDSAHSNRRALPTSRFAYVSIRQHTSAYVSIRQHTSAYVSIRQHMSAYASIRQHTWQHLCLLSCQRMLTYADVCVRIRGNTYVFSRHSGPRQYATTDFTTNFTTDFTTSNTCVVSSQWTTTVCLHSTSALLSKSRGASSTTTLYTGFS
jgi:hypothetical protein